MTIPPGNFWNHIATDVKRCLRMSIPQPKLTLWCVAKVWGKKAVYSVSMTILPKEPECLPLLLCFWSTTDFFFLSHVSYNYCVSNWILLCRALQNDAWLPGLKKKIATDILGNIEKPLCFPIWSWKAYYSWNSFTETSLPKLLWEKRVLQKASPPSADLADAFNQLHIAFPPGLPTQSFFICAASSARLFHFEWKL